MIASSHRYSCEISFFLFLVFSSSSSSFADDVGFLNREIFSLLGESFEIVGIEIEGDVSMTCQISLFLFFFLKLWDFFLFDLIR